MKSHGYTRTETYRSWANLKARCTNPRHPRYAWYGGRGITLAPEWHRFENFLADMGPRPLGLTVERIDNNKGYCKENCKWATRSEQAKNRNFCLRYEIGGRTMVLKDWAREFGMPYMMLYKRVKKGIPIERALSMPRMLNQFSVRA